MEFNFPKKEGTGIAKLIPKVSADCQDVIVKLLAYNLDNRMSAGQALKHPFFKDLRDQDIAIQEGNAALHASMRMTQRANDSMSQ